jgi:hypothetical protein
LSAFSSASRPFASRSSFCSREKNWRILLRARDEPVAGGAARCGLARQDLDAVAAAEPVMERDDPAVHLRADRAVADVGVDGVGEVDRRRAGRQRLHLVLRCEDEHLLVEEIGAEALDELAGVGLVGVDVHQLPHPGVPLLRSVLRAAPVSHVGPVRGDAELGGLVHLACPHLDLERTSLRTDDGRMEGAVAVELRHRDVVLEAAGHRLPQ